MVLSYHTTAAQTSSPITSGSTHKLCPRSYANPNSLQPRTAGKNFMQSPAVKYSLKSTSHANETEKCPLRLQEGARLASGYLYTVTVEESQTCLAGFIVLVLATSGPIRSRCHSAFVKSSFQIHFIEQFRRIKHPAKSL